jgi:hypothetical protein
MISEIRVMLRLNFKFFVRGQPLSWSVWLEHKESYLVPVPILTSYSWGGKTTKLAKASKISHPVTN